MVISNVSGTKLEHIKKNSFCALAMDFLNTMDIMVNANRYEP